MRGRPAKSADEHQRAGTFRRDRHKGKGLSPVDVTPEAPPWLDEEGKSFWAEYGPLCAAAGTLRPEFVVCFSLLCDTWSRWSTVRQQLDAEGPTTLSAAGTPKVSPLATLYDSLGKALLVMLRELGMTPAARIRLGITDSPAPEADGKNRFFKLYPGDN